MKNNRLLIGGVVLVVLLGIVALLIKNQKDSDAGTAGPTVTLPRIDKATIDALEIRRANGESIKLSKSADGQWRVVEPLEARADQSNVTTALDKLAELEVRGVAASRAENHARLEVDETKGVHVVARAGNTVAADLWIGVYRGSNTMVRKNGENTVAGVQGSIRYAFDRALKDWRHRMILETPADSIGDIRFVSSHGTFHFRKDGTTWAPASDQAAIERFTSTKVGSIVASLARLRATDFAEPSVTPEQAGLGPEAATVTLSFTSDAGEQQVMFRVGATKPGGNNEYYLQREGDPIIYVITGFLANKLQPTTESFQAAADAGVSPPDDEEPGAMPMGAGMPMPAGGPGQQQIPPEIMRQLQEQMRQRGMQPPQ